MLQTPDFGHRPIILEGGVNKGVILERREGESEGKGEGESEGEGEGEIAVKGVSDNPTPATRICALGLD